VTTTKDARPNRGFVLGAAGSALGVITTLLIKCVHDVISRPPGRLAQDHPLSRPGLCGVR
jgi:hypothetical protein